jgi:hypothetical protein
MLSFHLGPLSRRARMFLHLVAGCAGLCVLLGPTLLALADAPPIAGATSWAPLRLLAVKPFQNLGAGSCVLNVPLHEGPTAAQGTVSGQSALRARLTDAMLACAGDDWTGGLTISTAVDARGTVTDVRMDGDASPIMQRCLRTRIFHGDPSETRGPGTLRASYFMGRRRIRR